MSDEVDDLLRRTMATLDRQVPDGYFDTLVSRALVRLDDPALAELPDPRADESQDSHDEDAPPASSAPGWKAIALAEPAKASDPAPAPAATDQAAVMPGRRAPSNRRPIAAVVGLGLAVAAGATIFVGTRDKTASAPEAAQAREQVDAVATNRAPTGAGPEVTPVETVASGSAVVASTPAPAEAPAGSAARGDQSAQAEKPAGNAAQAARPVAPAVEQGAVVGKLGRKPVATKGGGKAALTEEPTKFKGRARDTLEEGKPGRSAPGPGKTMKGALPGHDRERSVGKPSEQGVPAPNEDKPGPDTPLSSDDIKRGMSAVAGKAKACFAGTEGTATVQLTVAPSGRVQKAAVTGLFAGTPTGACVEQAVRAATFPPFDGEPQNFAYAYLISN